MVTATERHRSPGSDARRVGLLSHALHLEQKEMNTEMLETGQPLTITLNFYPSSVCQCILRSKSFNVRGILIKR